MKRKLLPEFICMHNPGFGNEKLAIPRTFTHNNIEYASYITCYACFEEIRAKITEDE
jgi:hypothetical protein